MIIDELITKLTFKHDKAGARRHETNMRSMVRVADRHVRSMERSFSGSSSRISKMMRWSVKLHGIGAAKTQLSSVESAARKVVKGIGGIAAAYVGINAAKKFVENTFNATGEKQMQMARLETVLGSKSLAVQKYKMMADFGEATPYQKNDLLSGFSSVAGSGYQMTNRDLTALGDVSAGSGKDSFAPMIEMLKSANRGMGSMVDNFDGMKASAKDGMLEMQRYDKSMKKWITKNVMAGDMAGIVAFVRDHGEANYKGQMDKMSKTLPGLMSTLKDKIAQRFEDIGDAGMDKIFEGMMKGMVEMADKMKPLAQRFGALSAEYIPKTIEGMKELLPLLKPVGLGFGLIATHLIGIKTMGLFMAGGPVARMAAILGGALLHLKGFIALASMAGAWATLKTLVAGAFTAMGAALTPLLIGGAIVAALAGVAYLGYTLYKYWTEGASALEGLRKRFPGLADAVQYLGDSLFELYTELKPELTYIWDQLKSLGKTIWEYLVPAAKWFFENVFIFLLKEAITTTAEFIHDWVEGYKVLKQGWEDWKVGFQIAWDYIKGPMEWLFGKLEWLAKNTTLAGLLGQAATLFNGGGGGDSGGGTGTSSATGGALPTAASSNGSRLLQSMTSISTLPGYCYQAVYGGIAKAFGQDNAIKKAGQKYWEHAYQAADVLAKSKDWHEVKVTTQMLQDPNFRQRLNGGVAVYDQQSGFSKLSGHIEALDTVNNKSHYGRGAVNRNLANLSPNMVKHMRVFVPVSPQASTMPNIGRSTATGSGGATVNQTMNFNGPANPQQVRNAAQNGTQTALNRAGLSSPKPSTAR